MKKMEKHLKRVLSILLVAVLLAQAAWTPTTSRAATDSEATANQDVYVSASGSDSANGTEAAPLKTLEKAFQVVANGGTIHIVGTCETGSWSAHGKNITITGENTEGVLKFISDENKYIKLNGLGGLGDVLTFENITIDAVDNHRLLANGCKIKIGENVATTGKPYIYGGCYTSKATLYGDSYVEVNSGTWGRIYGGGNDAAIQQGSTHVVVGGTAVCDAIYGSGMGDTITGSTNVTVTGNASATYVYGGGTWSSHGEPAVNGGTNVVIEENATIMSVNGGSNYYGNTGNNELVSKGNTSVLVKGGTVEQVFGGNRDAFLEGNVDVQVLGGKVSRRIYGGNYNEYSEENLSWNSACTVNGNIKLIIGSGADIDFSSTEKDRSIYACSRYGTKSADEITTLIFDDQTAYDEYKDKLKAQDLAMQILMAQVSNAADSMHLYTYTASGNTITANCDGTLCGTAHSATATLSAIKDEFAYTGKAIEGAQIVYDGAWDAAPMEIIYTGNNKVGTATATCSKSNGSESDSASVSVNFEIKSTALSGKNISILGDSISTYEGVSNNANINKTIRKNNVYYSTGEGKALPTQNLTYWGQLIEKYGMNLCVNNSTGGGKVSIDVGTDGVRPSGIKRSTELHNNDGQEPDIILVNMGTNDLADTGISLAQFAEAYTQMLDNMLEKYENAEIFCFTLLPGRDYSSTETANGETFEKYLIKFNNQIERIVGGYEDRVTLVDMYTESGIAWNNLSLYTCDYSETYPGLHPNEEGMQLMAKVLERALLDVYEPSETPNVDESSPIVTTVEPSFDLNFKNGKPENAGAEKVTVTATNGKIQYMDIERDGQTCKVPVFYAAQSSTTPSYLDVQFEKIKTAEEMEKWIFAEDKGITFECFFYVKSHPTETAGIMSGCNGGGISLYGVNRPEGMNFLIGSNDTSVTTLVNKDSQGRDRWKYSKTYSCATQHYDAGSAETKFNEGTLTHLVGTYDESTNMMAIYLDGELLGNGSYGDASFLLGSAEAGRIGIGANLPYTISKTKEHLNKTTDYAIVDARVYSDTLTAEQVEQEYNNRWNEVLETATETDVYFDLDFVTGSPDSVGTNADKTDITFPTSSQGNVTTLKVAHNGQLCDVPVYYAPKDENGTSGTNKSYLDVTFKDIADIEDATEKENALKDWIFNDGISFECFIYVDEIPANTAGFMTSLSSGGIGFYSYKARGELNFRMGALSGAKAKTATYPYNSTYACAFPTQDANVNVAGTGDSIVCYLQQAQEYQTLNAGKLTHVVGTYNKDTNVMSIYKDGELISSGSYCQGGRDDFKVMTAAIGHIGLGANIAAPSERMDKYTSYAIADARIYSGVLTAKQVAEQYNNRWDDVAKYAIKGEVDVDQLTDVDKYTIDSTAFDLSQDLGDAPAYKYGSVEGATYEGSITGDRDVLNDQDYTLHVFSNTTSSEYVSYLKDLKAAGWEQYSNNIIENENLFATYTKDGKSVYAYYIANKASTYIVVSETSYLENRKEDNDYKVVCDPLFTEVRTISSSQCEIVRLSDGRFIIIDSGQRDKDGTYQPQRIYEVLEEQNVLDKITVAAWIITHPHTDHMYACADFLTQYGAGDLDIEEIIFNFPNEEDYVAADSSMSTTVPQFYTALATAKTKWSGMDIITCHTGQEYHIADATIEILHTIEDSFPLKVNELADKVNDSSVAFKIKIAGQEIMILGDSGASVSDDLVDMWGDYLKSDFVQMSHHGMRGGTVELYEHVDPTVVTIPTTRGLMDPNLTENVDYIGKQEASVWVLVNLGKNIKEVNVAGYGTRTFTLPYTPENKEYISNIKQNGYEMKEGDKIKADDMPQPYADLGFNGTDLIDNGEADNTFTMVGGSVGENTVYYKGKPYTVTSYRAEKTSSNYEHIKLTMNEIKSADDLKKLLIEDGHTLEMFFAADSAPTKVGGLMSNCNSGGVTLYARRLGVLCYQLGNNSKADTYHNDKYASASYIYTKNEFNFEVGNTVTHVVATYDKVEGKLKLYQNGVLISQGTYTDPNTYFQSASNVATYFNQMGIGINIAYPSEALGKETGYTVIKSRIYNQTLSAEQVASEYWSCIEDLTGDENIYDDWDPEEADTCKKVTVPFTKTEVETFLTNGTHPTRKGYLFGGWYTTTDIPEIDVDNYEESAEEAMKVAIQDTVPDGVETVYALFVPEEVLTVKAQISGNLIDNDSTNDATGSIRFVTTVDSLMYKRVGFKVEYVNSQSVNKTIISDSKTVYEKLKAVDMSGNVGTELTYSPTQFCAASKYFKACTVESLSEKNFTREFTVTPFWETMDGSVVYGEPVVKSIQQYLDTLK